MLKLHSSQRFSRTHSVSMYQTCFVMRQNQYATWLVTLSGTAAYVEISIPLEPGFVHTVEPGIYFIPELIDLWKGQKKFTDFINYDKVETYKDFGGIRNEEDYLITETGARRLGKKIPLTPDEVEALR